MRVGRRYTTVLALFAMATAFVSSQQAQTGEEKKELSVEESYLQESVEAMVIREQSRAESRDMKLIALEYIGEAVDNGKANEESTKALEYLAFEGVTSKTREGGVGRLTNNYPDIRAKAAEYLGKIGGEDSKNVLVKMVLADPEPMVLTEAVKSLGKIGLNDNEEVVTAISWIVTRFNVLNPDNSLAFAALNAFDSIAEKNGGIKDPSTIRVIMKIAEGPYIRPVQARAIEVLGKLRQYNAASAANKDANKKK